MITGRAVHGYYIRRAAGFAAAIHDANEATTEVPSSREGAAKEMFPPSPFDSLHLARRDDAADLGRVETLLVLRSLKRRAKLRAYLASRSLIHAILRSLSDADAADRSLSPSCPYVNHIRARFAPTLAETRTRGFLESRTMHLPGMNFPDLRSQGYGRARSSGFVRPLTRGCFEFVGVALTSVLQGER